LGVVGYLSIEKEKMAHHVISYEFFFKKAQSISFLALLGKLLLKNSICNLFDDPAIL